MKEYELREVCEIVSGVILNNKDYKKTGVPVLRVKNIQNNRIQEEDLAYCDLSDFPKATFAKPGDVLIANRGSAGKVGINSSDKELLFTSNIFKLEPNPEILNKGYLYHFLLNCPKEIEKLINTRIIPQLCKTCLKKLKISAPSLEIQKKIAKTLDNFMDLKEELKLRKKQHNYYRERIIDHLSARVSAEE